MKQLSASQLFLILPFLSLFFFRDWKEVLFYLLIGTCICIAGIISAGAISNIAIVQYFTTKAKDKVFFNHKHNKE